MPIQSVYQNQQNIRNQINEMLATGYTKNQIFDEISKEYNGNKSIAAMIAKVPNKNLLIKYNWVRYVLIVLYIFAAIIIGYCYYANYNDKIFTLNKIIVGSIMYGVIFILNIYMIIKNKDIEFIFFLFIITTTNSKLFTNQDNMFYAFILIMLTTMGFTIFYKRKIFPYLKFGQVQKDVNGAYILE